MPKFPHAETQTAFTAPVAAPRLVSLAIENAYLPSFLFCIDHVRAKVSSLWPVMTSSQSFARVVEYASVVMGGSLSDVMGIDKFVAFFDSEPWLSSKLRESRTTLVHRRLRSVEAVSSCFPSSP